MSVITIDGQIGAGGSELGKRVARMFDFDYIDRITLPRSIVHTKANTHVGITDRFWTVVERAVSGFALGNAAGDPFFNVPTSLMLPLTWDSDGPVEKHSQIVGPSNVDNLFDHGKAVLVHRAGCVESDGRAAFKVGLFASWEDRVERVMKREGLKLASDAEKTIKLREKLQREYFGGIFGAQPEDRSLYDIIVDTSSENIPVASIKVARLARQSLAPQTE